MEGAHYAGAVFLIRKGQIMGNRSDNHFTGGLETLLLDALASCARVEFTENGNELVFDRRRAKDLIDEYMNQRAVGRGA